MQVDNLFLERILGKDVFGEIYLTKISGSNKYYATKSYNKERIGLDYLSNEIELLKQFNHPNIIKIIDMKQTYKHYYIVMEYCNGGNLRKVLDEYILKYGRGFPEEIIQYLMRQIISALMYLYKQNVIHRDIKFENILLNFDNEQDRINLNLMKAQIKITNFTLAIKIDFNIIPGDNKPEIVDSILLYKLHSKGIKYNDLKNDINSDISSLGWICYAMLIGKTALDSKDLEEIVGRVKTGKYTVPNKISKEIISFINAIEFEHIYINILAQHEFITRNINDFHHIVLNPRQLSKKLDNIKTIWSIFIEDDEKKCLNIKNVDAYMNVTNNLNNNANMINQGYNINNYKTNNLCDPILPQSMQGIQGNPIHQNNSMPQIPYQPSGQSKIIEKSYNFSANIYK